MTGIGRNHVASAVLEMSRYEFTTLVAEAFRLQGYRPLELDLWSSETDDQLPVLDGTDLYLVQYRHWKSKTVGTAALRSTLQAFAAHGAVGSFVVTSGIFSRQAKIFARRHAIVLISGQVLYQMLTKARASLRQQRRNPESLSVDRAW